jgi:DNA-directed RNA polymerase subunit beta'
LKLNPSNPAVVSEIDGVVSFGKNKEVTEIIIESKFGDIRKYQLNFKSNSCSRE